MGLMEVSVVEERVLIGYSYRMDERLHNDDYYAVVERRELPQKIAYKYLNIYIGFKESWEKEVSLLFNRLKKDKDLTKKVLCAAILLPSLDQAMQVDRAHPENHLHRIKSYQQFTWKADWFEEFRQVFIQDALIDAWRKKALILGVVSPLEYSPITRQAYNWLCDKAEESGIIISPEIKQDVSERFKNLVSVYGGAVVCNTFSRHADSLKKVVNWRTGYFFEKIIYDIYSIDQICKIKRNELDSTNERLVKQVRLVK